MTAAAGTGAHVRRRSCFPSDTNDAEWLLIEPTLPVPACQPLAGGRPETHPRRAVWDAIRYVNDSGCKWRALPQDFPPFQTVFGFFSRWTEAGVFNLIRDQLRRLVRIAMGASLHGVAVAIDSQSVKAAATVPRSTSGYDPGKKIVGRKRHMIVDLRNCVGSLHDKSSGRDVQFGGLSLVAGRHDWPLLGPLLGMDSLPRVTDEATVWRTLAALLPPAHAQEVMDSCSTGEQESALDLVVSGLLAQDIPPSGPASPLTVVRR